MAENKMRLKETPEYLAWSASIGDRMTQRRIDRRLARFQAGDIGDWASVGGGVYELRLHFGPGWRIFYSQASLGVYWLLGGAVKASQSEGVRMARETKKRLEVL